MAMLFLATVGMAYAQGQGVAGQDAATQSAAAQEPATDTTSVGASQSLDSLLVGVSIYDRLAEYNTEENQITHIREAFSKYIEQNSGK